MAEEHPASIDEETGHDVMDIYVLAIDHWCQFHTSVRPNLAFGESRTAMKRSRLSSSQHRTWSGGS
jgi:hypothetical protein